MNPFTLRPFRFDRAAINDWNRRNRRGIEAYFTRDDPTPCPGCGRPTKALTEQCQDCERSTGETMDERKPGEAFCATCPDHEACMTGYPCSLVKRVAGGAA